MATTTVEAPAERQYVTYHAAKGRAQRPILTGADMKKTFDSIPQIDFTHLNGTIEQRRELAKQVGDAFRESGFLYACNHGISEEIQANVLQAMKEFFALPAEEKMKIHINKSPEIKGYESLLETRLDSTTRGDLKEALNFGDDPTEPEQNCPPDFDLSYYPGNGTIPVNQWPTKPANFRQVMYQYHTAVMGFSRQLLHIIALALNLEEDYFDSMTRFPMAGLRPLYYPPQEVTDDLGIAAHADYSWFTVVNQLSDTPALDVLNANGHWVSAPPIKNTLVVNVGDFLERASNEVFVSTVHRVINKRPGADRYSIPLFFSPSHDAMIDIIPTCWGKDRPKKSEPILAGKWQKERLYRSRYKHPVAIAARARGEA